MDRQTDGQTDRVTDSRTARIRYYVFAMIDGSGFSPHTDFTINVAKVVTMHAQFLGLKLCRTEKVQKAK